MNNQADFFIPGPQKGGSTSLSSWIAQHPSVYAPEFLKDHPVFLEEGKSFKQKFQELNSFLENKEHYIKGIGSTQYLYFTEVIPEIKKYNPDIELIITLRNPVYRAFSAYRHARERSMEQRKFTQAVNEEIEKGPDIYKHLNDKQRKLYVWRGLYYTQIKTHFQHFDRNNTFICLFEDLLHNKEKLVGELFDFLNVDSSFQPEFENKNVTKGAPRFNWINNLLFNSEIRNAPSTKPLKKYLSRKFKYNFVTTIKNLNRKEPPDEKIPSETYQTLRNFHREDIKSPESLIERDLSDWYN